MNASRLVIVREPCPDCEQGWVVCLHCGGSGELGKIHRLPSHCFGCRGRGLLPCRSCRGQGFTEREEQRS